MDSNCDLLSEASALTTDPSTWNTIASPHFTIYQRNRKCWNGGNPDDADPEGRILTGKNKVFDPEFELEDLESFALEPHHQAERHYEGQGSQPSPAFAGFSGGSFYQVDAIDKKAIYAYPDQPVKPVYKPAKPVFVDPDTPVVIEEKQFFDPTLNQGKATKLRFHVI